MGRETGTGPRSRPLSGSVRPCVNTDMFERKLEVQQIQKLWYDSRPGPPDHRTPDHRTTGPPDTGPPDTGPLDHRTPDHRTPDHRTPTTGSAAPDTGQPDTGPPDHNYSCVRTGAYHDPPAQATIPLRKLVYPLGPGVPASSQTPFSWCWRHGFGKSMGVRQGLNQMAPKCQWMTFISHHPPDTCRRPWEIFEDDCQESNGRVPSVADTW